MPPKRRAAGRPQPPSPPITLESQPQGQWNYSRFAAAVTSENVVPQVRAEAFPPAGRRSTWLLLVRSCVWCGCAHAHRGGPTGGVRESGCARGTYELKPIIMMPARCAA